MSTSNMAAATRPAQSARSRSTPGIRRLRSAPASRRNASARHAADTSRDFGSFLDDLLQLVRGRVGEAGDELRTQVEERVSLARDQIGGALEQAQQAGSEMSARAREGVQRGIDNSLAVVLERPIASVCIAAVGGLIAGLWIASRR
jgi:ElaB/YqjD/DUF883 family membrane-anchored ribosome-binding protein